MKVLTGSLKGLVLASPGGKLRPTPDKVRKAIFDILGDSIRDVSFLELFAGSGSVGIEALSCGAGFVCFVENERNSLRLLRQNLIKTKLANYEIATEDAFLAIEQFAREKRKFDIIFIDPPYYQEIAKKILLSLTSYDILNPSGFVIIQHFKKDLIPEKTDSFNLFKKKIYGDTVVSFYQMNPP